MARKDSTACECEGNPLPVIMAVSGVDIALATFVRDYYFLSNDYSINCWKKEKKQACGISLKKLLYCIYFLKLFSSFLCKVQYIILKGPAYFIVLIT